MASAPSAAEDVSTSYRVSLSRAGDGPDAAWVAEVEDLPNSSARGATPEEAIRRALAAAEQPLGPSDGSGEEARGKRGARHSGRLLVRMPATLHGELARAAEREGVSLNQFITGVLAVAVEWGSGEERTAGRSASAAGSPGSTRLLLLANLVVLAIAAVAALVLLVVAWQS